jgi:Uma2 family endonuclease
MTQTLSKLVTYEEFIEWLPNDGKRYELHDGVIVEMPQLTGKHEKVTSFLTLYRGDTLIVSPTFPQLNLTAQQIFDAAL